MRNLLIALFLLPTLALAQQLHTFKNGEVADADKINENFQNLVDRLPEQDSSYAFVEQRTLEDGKVFTKLRLYEKASFSGFRVDRRIDDPNLAYEDWGQETSINALGSFDTAYIYVYPPKTNIPNPTNTDLPTTCPDGSAPEFWYQASYSYAMRSITGAIQFSTAYGDMSGIYQCASYVCGDDCPNDFNEFYIMEGQGIGDYSCIESVVMYGLLGGGNARAWNKVKGPNWVTGVFDASYNDEFGTYFLEIIAPAGCITSQE
jgi:hypothetical protein